MVKLVSARERRVYGPRLARTRSEYTNAGLYVLATVVLLGGLAGQYSREAKSGLVLILIAYLIIVLVNLHDLMAHLAGVDFRFGLMEFDTQLALVEFSSPLVHILGTLLSFFAILFLFIQEEKGYGYLKLQKHALNMLIAGPALWLLGSIQNSCQIYERADGHIQILQQSVHIPFLMGSLLFFIGAILNAKEHTTHHHSRHGLDLLGGCWLWMGIFGSLLFFVGGITNVVKASEMQRVVDGPQLEKLRGGADEGSCDECDDKGEECNTPRMVDEQRRMRWREKEEKLIADMQSLLSASRV